MAPQLATNRLRKELVILKKDPPPGIIAEPNENDILVWHYAIRGPEDTPYQGGTYVGKLKFPSEYPLKAPSIYMLTPSGRFQCNTKICMSMSDFHPESWNPLWSVATIIQGIQSFMASDEMTTGSVQEKEEARKKFAAASMAYNQKMFPRLFDGNIEASFGEAEEARKQAEQTRVVDNGSTTRGRRIRGKKQDTQKVDDDDEKEEQQQKDELTSEEVEKRRKRNAKKRAKQKAKKTTTAEHSENDAAEDDD